MATLNDLQTRLTKLQARLTNINEEIAQEEARKQDNEKEIEKIEQEIRSSAASDHDKRWYDKLKQHLLPELKRKLTRLRDAKASIEIIIKQQQEALEENRQEAESIMGGKRKSRKSRKMKKSKRRRKSKKMKKSRKRKSRK
jgi:hypothetical protein